ncbi:MAG: nitroreductase family protein [Succinivibrionaceae bacterium]|nr:nitroreductase family protein [Succinivibrionaceae bacterium]
MEGNPIFSRTSTRSFAPGEVSAQEEEMLLRAGMAAPSAHNQQPWEFYVIRDPATLARLGDATPYSGPARGAALCIVTCQREGIRDPLSAPLDMGACTQNILIEAEALGLGAVWLSCAPYPERMRAVAGAVGIAPGLSPFAVLAIGRIGSRRPFVSRYDPARVHRA